MQRVHSRVPGNKPASNKIIIIQGATAGHAQELGFRTIFLEDCSRGIDPIDIKDTLEGVRANHGVVINANEVR